jgi:hypothetical protein
MEVKAAPKETPREEVVPNIVALIPLMEFLPPLS